MGVGLSTLFEFMVISPLSGAGYLLYAIPVLMFLCLVTPLCRQPVPFGYAVLILGVMGVIATALSVSEAMSHIDLFGEACRSVPALRTAIGSSHPAVGALVGILAYGASAAYGVLVAGRPVHDKQKETIHNPSGLPVDQ